MIKNLHVGCWVGSAYEILSIMKSHFGFVAFSRGTMNSSLYFLAWVRQWGSCAHIGIILNELNVGTNHLLIHTNYVDGSIHVIVDVS